MILPDYMTNWHLLQHCPAGYFRTCLGWPTALKDKHPHTDYLLSPVDCGRKNNLYLQQLWDQILTLQGIHEHRQEFGKCAQNSSVHRHGGGAIASVMTFLSANANHFPKLHLTPKEEDCNMHLQISLIISNTVYCACSFGDLDRFLIFFPFKVVEFTLDFLTLGPAEFILTIHNQLTSEVFSWLGYILIFVVYDKPFPKLVFNPQHWKPELSYSLLADQWKCSPSTVKGKMAETRTKLMPWTGKVKRWLLPGQTK